MLAPFPIWPSRCSLAKYTPRGEDHNGFLHTARQTSPSMVLVLEEFNVAPAVR